jgi:peroxiredoxin Q/BCP
MTLKINTKAPNFKLPSTSKDNYSLKESIGKYVSYLFLSKR